MPSRVAAHEPPPSKHTVHNFDRFQSQRSRAVTLLPRNPRAAGLLVNTCIEGAVVGAQLEKPRALVLDFLTAALDLGCAAFRLAGVEGTVTIPIDGQQLALAATGPTDNTTPAMWLRVFGLSLALRRPDATVALCAVDVDILRRSPTQVDDFRYEVVSAMQDFALGRNWRAAAARAVERAQPQHTRVAGREYVEVELSEVKMLEPLDARDAAAFDRAFAAALEAHKAYWGSKQWIGHAIGRIAVTPLGLAALAHDRGLAFDLESGYVPAWLVRGELA